MFIECANAGQEVHTTPPEEYEGNVYELTNALLLCDRIRRKERALEEEHGYGEAFENGSMIRPGGASRNFEFSTQKIWKQRDRCFQILISD